MLRLRYADGALSLDEGWGGSYAVEGADQSAGWDTCLGSGSLWMMDMGRPPNWGMNRAVAAVAVGLKTLGSFGVPGMKRLGNSALGAAMGMATGPQHVCRAIIAGHLGCILPKKSAMPAAIVRTGLSLHNRRPGGARRRGRHRHTERFQPRAAAV